MDFAAIRKYIFEQPASEAVDVPSHANGAFDKLRQLGTELWLDTGDVAAASKTWDRSLTCLTTNNTLLNQVIQTGIYDGLIQQTIKSLPASMDSQTKVSAISFMLNAAHGRKLAQTFGNRVSVELHTDFAHDWKQSVEFGKQFVAIGGQSFIVKIPMTPDGLIAARKLFEAGIDVNFTLGFSARHNYVATRLSHPAYCNVFLGRLNQYMQSNKLGSGDFVGEKATLASQKYIRAVDRRTKQIAASMRSGDQCATLAGVDVFTMPIAVAEKAKTPSEDQTRKYGLEELHLMRVGVDNAAGLALEKLWNVDDSVVQFCDAVEKDATALENPARIVDLAHQYGCGDLFPRWSAEDLKTIEVDGKIPVHAKWAARVKSGELAIDTLLQNAALLSFTVDQKALDDRIRSFL
eukprot:ANDGO_05767.mRNA.1 Transaldolase